MNTPEFYDEIYTAKPDKWALEWRDKQAYDLVSSHIKPKSILDIGCGNGHTLKYFSDRIDADYFGIDLSPVAVEIAKEKMPGAYIMRGDYMEKSHPYVDLILLMGVAEHFLFLDRLFEKLKEDGKYIYMEVPNCLKYSNVKREGYRETHNGSGQAEWHLERKSWERYIEKAGFEVIEAAKGKTADNFIWLLKSPRMYHGHPVMDDIVPR